MLKSRISNSSSNLSAEYPFSARGGLKGIRATGEGSEMMFLVSSASLQAKLSKLAADVRQ